MPEVRAPNVGTARRELPCCAGVALCGHSRYTSAAPAAAPPTANETMLAVFNVEWSLWRFA